LSNKSDFQLTNSLLDGMFRNIAAIGDFYTSLCLQGLGGKLSGRAAISAQVADMFLKHLAI
jgi:hypothetical protein